MATNDYCRCLWQVDTRTGNASTLRIGSEFTTGWVVDRSGRAVAREDWDWQHHAYRVFALPDQADEKLREIYRRDDSESPKLRGLLGDGSALVLLASSGHGYQAAWAVPLDGTAPRVIAEVPNADVTDVFIDPFSGAVAGVYTGGNPTEIKWLESTAQHRQEVLQRSFPGRQVSVYGWTSDATKTLARVETPSSPPVYYLVDFVSHRADVVAEEYPALASVKLGEKKAITYTARDGTAIPAYLTMPPVNVPGPIPLVVLPHGGPQARDHLEFDWLSQFIASRGYAVLQPQFRGSTGFGDAFREAGYRQWGGLMQDDVTDGVKAMIDQGIADARRVCIVGASYGGYAALAGAAFTPDIYACAVSIAGVSDLRALLHEQAPYIGVIASTSLSGWKEHIGSPHDASLGAKSPINSVKTIKSPVLIMYGTGDGVVPTDQSLRMAKALKDAGKEVKVVALRNEDHWLSRSETRVQVLKELETFLQAHLH
jgi:dipeptidyl aminopeptidase/acylaminoacyl peptidase